MPHVNGFAYQPTKDLNRLLREYGTVCLNDTTPPALSNTTNITWQTDSEGNVSACVAGGGGGGGVSAFNSRTGSVVLLPGDVTTALGFNPLANITGLVVPGTNVAITGSGTSASPYVVSSTGGGGGGGGVNPGTAFDLSFYASTGSTVSAATLTTDVTGSNLTVPGVFEPTTELPNYPVTLPTGSGNPSGVLYTQRNATMTAVGTGWNLGNTGGWTVTDGNVMTLNASVRGISQMYGGTINKHAIGDTASHYTYNRHDGGFAAQSDEGITGATIQVLENSGYFHGKVATTTGHGDQAPTFTFLSGNDWTTDGAFLLNITKGTLSGTLTGAGSIVSMTTNSGSAATFLSALPVTGVTLPVSTAIGIATAAIVNPQVTANNPVSTSVVVNLVSIGGIFKTFTIGQVVTVAGANYPEQAVLTNVATTGTNQQTLTMKLRNPNTQAIIFQGGIQGQYISFDANLALSGMRSSYYAFGSLTGTDLIYGSIIQGSLIGVTIPSPGYEAAQTSGANSAFHLYPGAEVVANTTFGAVPTLEQNNVTWAVNDLVENPHYPTYAGTGIFLNKFQQTPSNGGSGLNGFAVVLSGPGVAGINGSAMNLQNSNPNTLYTANGGPLIAVDAFKMQGNFKNIFHVLTGPDNAAGGSVFAIGGPANPSDTSMSIVGIDVTNGSLTFDLVNHRWVMPELNAGGYAVGGVAGASGTFTSGGHTLTFVNGIVTSIT